MSAAALPMSLNTIALFDGLDRAVNDVFLTMLNIQPVPLLPEDSNPGMGVSAIIGFGGKVSGFLALHMTPQDACTLAAGMLGMDFSELDEVVSDAIGEIANMLAGSIKKYASQHEELFKISLPTVISGDSYSTHVPKCSEQRTLRVQAGSCLLGIQLVVEQI
jgi:chemotaxis protein CheX